MPRTASVRALQGVVAGIGAVSRVTGRGGGAVIGGRVALALDKGALGKLTAGRSLYLVSGTNGKTTTTALLAAALGTAGPVVTNLTGANLKTGLVSALARDLDSTVAVLEVDEAALVQVLAETTATVVVLLNLSRDQLDRYGEVRLAAQKWRTSLGARPEVHVVANCDDPLVVWAAQAAGTVTWVSTGQRWRIDASSCPNCGGRIVWGRGSGGVPPIAAAGAAPARGSGGVPPIAAAGAAPARGSGGVPPIAAAGAAPARGSGGVPPIAAAGAAPARGSGGVPPIAAAGAAPARGSGGVPPIAAAGAAPARGSGGVPPIAAAGAAPARGSGGVPPIAAAGAAPDGEQWSCSCGLARPEPEIGGGGDEVVVEGRSFPVQLQLPGRCNASNAAMAMAAAGIAGVDPEDALAAMVGIANVAGRYREVNLGSASARLLLAKNPAGWNEILDFLAAPPAGVVVAVNAQGPDGYDTSWLWDVDFERLEGRPVVAAGERALDVAVRLRYAGVPHQVCPDPLAAARQLPPGKVELVANYTAFQTVLGAVRG